MKNNPFQVTSPPIASMIGRSREMGQLLSHLQKEVPDHVSVIGPRFIGKTVLLHALGMNFAGGGKDFNACLYWDIRHGLPASDDEFLSEFAGGLKGPIERINPDAAKLLASEGSGFEAIKIVFETLQEDNKRLLIIMDGFDGVLLSPDITKNLWDNLRSLAELTSIRFVTGSRRRLRELCARPDSKTSDFWNIFYDTPLAVGAFSPNDFGDFVQLFKKAGVMFERGADTELSNWCGGIPIATSFHCNRLWDSVSEGQTVSPALVNESCEMAMDGGQDYWQGLWDDCSHEDRAFLFEVTKAGELLEDSSNRKRAASLTQRGFLTITDHRIRFSSRTFQKFTEQVGPSSTELRRLFGTPEEFRRNAKPLAEIRLEQMPAGDKQLRDLVSTAVANLDKANIVLNLVRGFVNRALLMIWDSEIPDRKIPADWTFKWQDGNADPPAGTISPDDVGRQLRLLNFMTGNRRAAPTRIRRSTYLMLNALKGIGDFGVHLGNELLGVGFGVVVAFLLIEVFEHLVSDLASTPS